MISVGAKHFPQPSQISLLTPFHHICINGHQFCTNISSYLQQQTSSTPAVTFQQAEFSYGIEMRKFSLASWFAGHLPQGMCHLTNLFGHCFFLQPPIEKWRACHKKVLQSGFHPEKRLEPRPRDLSPHEAPDFRVVRRRTFPDPATPTGGGGEGGQ